MRVKVLVSISGSEYTGRPGDELTVDDAEGGRLIAAGFAAPLKAGESGNPPVVTTPPPPPAGVETATSKAVAKREKAAGPKPKGKGSKG